MGISIDKIFNHSQKNIIKENNNKDVHIKKPAVRQFDEIVISSYKNEDEENIINELSSKVKMSLNKDMSEEQIERLRQQVQTDEYVIDAKEIASRILLLGK